MSISYKKALFLLLISAAMLHYSNTYAFGYIRQSTLKPHFTPNKKINSNFQLFNGNLTLTKPLRSHILSIDTFKNQLTNKRKWVVAGAHAGLYTGALLILNEAWYKNYPKAPFHTFNDMHEWLQVDKAGHTWSAYQLSRASAATWKWAGYNQKQQAWMGALSGLGFQTVVEVLDAYSAEWGWSWGDIAANLMGSGLFLGQELAFKEQRISFKFSFHKMSYSDPQLMERTNSLFGANLQEAILKNYNTQTYWLSANLQSFMPKSNLPKWLNIAVGYGGSGMLGGENNIWVDNAGNTQNRTDIKRVRQWYIAPDIDFTRIPTNNKWVRSLLFLANAIKIPSPAVMYANGKLTFYGFYF